MYKSPIDIIYGQMETQLEDHVMRAVQSVHVNVDKDELLKALQEDRRQYEKGYLDGKADATPKWIPVTERLPEEQREYLCFCNIDGHTEYPFYMVLKYYLVDEKPHFQHECEHGLRVTHWMELHEPPKGE